MLKKSASGHRLCRVKRETCEKGAIRSSKFRKPPACLARLSCGIISCCPRHTGHWVSGVPQQFFRSLLERFCG